MLTNKVFNPITAFVIVLLFTLSNANGMKDNKNDALLLDYSMFAQRQKNITSSFDYINDVNMRATQLLKEGNTLAAQNLCELVHTYISNGIKDVVTLDEKRTATPEELVIVANTADLYVHALNTNYPKLNGIWGDTRSIKGEERKTFVMMDRVDKVFKGDDPTGRQNAEYFTSLVLRKNGVTAAVFDQHITIFKKFFASAGILETEGKNSTFFIVLRNLSELKVTPASISRILKSLDNDPLIQLKGIGFSITPKNKSSVQRFELNTTTFKDHWYGYTYERDYGKGDGSCFFHAALRDKSDKTTYPEIKKQIINETDSVKQKMFFDYVRENKAIFINMALVCNKATTKEAAWTLIEGFIEKDKYKDLVKMYFDVFDTNVLPSEQGYPSFKSVLIPSTLYCYLYEIASFCYKQLRDTGESEAVYSYVPSTLKGLITMGHDGITLEYGNHYEILMPKEFKRPITS